MRKALMYMVLPFVSLLFACSDEDALPVPGDKESVKIPVSIEIATGRAGQLVTRATNLAVDGTCDVDEIVLLVYSGAGSITNRNDLSYDSEQVLTCNKENGRWIARGTITGVPNQKYALFAIGYNKAKEGGKFTIDKGTPRNYGNVKVRLTPTPVLGTLNHYDTPEFFVGNIAPKGASEVFTADGEVALTGTLYRAVGKCTFTITDIPANIKKVAWLTEKIADYNVLYRTNTVDSDQYPMGIPGQDELHKAISEVAYAENVAVAGTWTASMESFFIPLLNSLYYVDATDDGGNTTRYMVKCADHWSYTIWIGIINFGVQSYRFSIVHNYQMSVNGRFEQLKNSGNMLIDFGNMDEYDGGLIS